MTPPDSTPFSINGSPCSSNKVPWNVTDSPEIEEPVISVISITVGAKTMTLVDVSSPTRPVVPSIPENITLISIGPATLFESTTNEVLAKPEESVVTLEIITPSTIIETTTESTGEAELSINESEIFISSPRTILLSGSKSRGLTIVSRE